MQTLADAFRNRRAVALPSLSLLALSLSMLAGTAAARTYAFPHVFETRGRTSDTPYTFDTTMFLTYAGGVACVGGVEDPLSVSLYLYDDDGSPMRSTSGLDVCNPCTYPLGPTHRKESVRVENLFLTADEMPNSLTGYAVVDVPGTGDDVAVSGFIVNAHTSAFDLSVFGFEPTPIAAAANKSAAFTCGRVFTMDNLLYSPGTGGGTSFTFDTTMFMTYTAGQAGTPSGGGAAVDVYLFDQESGELLTDAVGTPVCNPCTTNLDDATRKSAFQLGAALPGGAVISAAVSAVIVVSGDAGNVALQGFVVNTHSGPLDVSMSAAPLHEVTAESATGLPPALLDRLGLRSYPNPFNPLTTFAYTLTRQDRVQIRVFDAQGELVRTLLDEAQLDGDHEVSWDGVADDGRQLPSGVYFGRIDTAGRSEVQKVVLIK
ncbi:MAG: T9SS type A sorting domain-containing protein [bacterium]|nr:T9SS type A sorting domain-containing protein [bacterium]MBK7702444.1 T9SS type A sorting domain-containing protein [bacterium]